ncbi:hypothetical protein JI667_03735 [Bacillus sp. NTK074B]|nr:hypothetical protein [Bacillus sp. NTK074B]
MEVSRQLSLKKKDPFQHVTKMDFQLPVKTSNSLPIELIMNGMIISKNLTPPNTVTNGWKRNAAAEDYQLEKFITGLSVVMVLFL